MTYKIRVSDPRCKFSAAHFLYQHDKCSRLHGHNYLVNVDIEGELNEQFYIVDFYEVKQLLMGITNELDHRMLLPSANENIKITEDATKKQIFVDFNKKHYEFPKQDVCLLPIPATTAEILAKYVYDKLKKRFSSYIITVYVGEAEGSVASYTE
ncbi:MAG: 6-pyruvoyl tetrahydropterin synthase family protein [Candidatus Lokiarchaeota archaeon]|nr:6-pyruvoyl tetrahydropterin synthase family protein [Candidatus Lokiarchaeota archaeon]